MKYLTIGDILIIAVGHVGLPQICPSQHVSHPERSKKLVNPDSDNESPAEKISL